MSWFQEALHDPTISYIFQLKQIITHGKIDLSEIFQQYDKQGNGTLNLVEFREFVQQADPHIPFDAIYRIFQKIAGNDGLIQFQEFQQALRQPIINQSIVNQPIVNQQIANQSIVNQPLLNNPIASIPDAAVEKENSWTTALCESRRSEKSKRAVIIKKMDNLKASHEAGGINLFKIRDRCGIYIPYNRFFQVLSDDYSCFLTQTEQEDLLVAAGSYSLMNVNQFYAFLHLDEKVQSSLTISSLANELRKTPFNKLLSNNAFKNNFDIQDEKIQGVDEFLRLFAENSSSRNQNQSSIFQDSEFPPVPSSLCESSTSRGSIIYKNYVWKLPDEYINGDWDIFNQEIQMAVSTAIGQKNIIEPEDIRQGLLGDCYFLASISSLAINPDRIVKLFATRKKNSQGIYGVFLCAEGVMRLVTIDGYCPCETSRKGPAFTQCSGPEIWVQLLEKAWAKLHKSYERIEAGLCRDALRGLTGAPSKVVFTTESDASTAPNPELWKELVKAVENK